jgi:hypothetical protein
MLIKESEMEKLKAKLNEILEVHIYHKGFRDIVIERIIKVIKEGI